MAGMNWLIRPTHSARASGDGTPRMARNTQVQAEDTAASTSRE